MKLLKVLKTERFKLKNKIKHPVCGCCMTFHRRSIVVVRFNFSLFLSLSFYFSRRVCTKPGGFVLLPQAYRKTA